jgi:uncharacterized membrane protein YfcA
MKTNNPKMDTSIVLILLLIGVSAGVLSGLIGVGGGIIIVPCLVLFLGFSQKMAQGTSLGILLLPIGILGALQYYKEGYIDIKVVGIISIAFLFGSYFGGKIAMYLSQENIKKLFALILMIVALKMLFFDKPKQGHSHPLYLEKKSDLNTKDHQMQ